MALELLDRLRLVGDAGAGSRRLGSEQALEPAEEAATAFALRGRLGTARRAARGRRTIPPAAAAIAASAAVGATAPSAAFAAFAAVPPLAATAAIGALAAPGALAAFAAGLPAVGAEFVAPFGARFTARLALAAIAPFGTVTARRAVGPVAAVVTTAAAGTFDVQAGCFGIARNARVPLCPPNPIEFESAAVTGTVRA